MLIYWGGAAYYFFSVFCNSVSALTLKSNHSEPISLSLSLSLSLSVWRCTQQQTPCLQRRECCPVPSYSAGARWHFVRRDLSQKSFPGKQRNWWREEPLEYDLSALGPEEAPWRAMVQKGPAPVWVSARWRAALSARSSSPRCWATRSCAPPSSNSDTSDPKSPISSSYPSQFPISSWLFWSCRGKQSLRWPAAGSSGAFVTLG